MEKDEKYYFLLRQENLYWGNRILLYKKWYRKLYGGEWTLLKFGKDTPYIRMFGTWTKLPDCFSGYKEVLEKESYPETNVDTRWKLFKQFLKQFFKMK